MENGGLIGLLTLNFLGGRGKRLNQYQNLDISLLRVGFFIPRMGNLMIF